MNHWPKSFHSRFLIVCDYQVSSCETARTHARILLYMALWPANSWTLTIPIGGLHQINKQRKNLCANRSLYVVLKCVVLLALLMSVVVVVLSFISFICLLEIIDRNDCTWTLSASFVVASVSNNYNVPLKKCTINGFSPVHIVYS